MIAARWNEKANGMKWIGKLELRTGFGEHWEPGTISVKIDDLGTKKGFFLSFVDNLRRLVFSGGVFFQDREPPEAD